VVEPPDSQLTFEGGLDGCLDFNLTEGFRKAFAYGEWKADQLASFLVRHEAYFPESFSRPSFLDNHDMNRFLWAAEGDLRRLHLAALCQFTLAGAPVIYYGTEVGLSQLRDVRQDGRGLPEESRLLMLWGSAQNEDLLKYYHELIQIRRNHPALGRGKVRVLHADKDVLLYMKDGSDKLLIALNLSQEPQKVKIQNGSKDILVETGENAAQCGKSEMTLSPLAGAIILVH
jgi:glycosidase